MEELFIQEDFISRRIGWLSNHDIRRGLVLSQSVITSPFLSVEDLVAAYLARGSGRNLSVGYAQFMQALLLGNYNNFQQDESSFILNVFSISADFPSSPLLKLSLIKILIDKAGAADDSGGYTPFSQILLYFGSMGVSEEAVVDALKSLMDYRLVQPFDASSTELVGDQRLAITHSGRVHYEMAVSDPIYVSQMSFATPIRNDTIVVRLRAIKAGRMGGREWHKVRRTFLLYCFAEDRAFVRIPKDTMFDGQRQLRKDLFGRWIKVGEELEAELAADQGEKTAFPATVASRLSPANHLSASVIWFDAAKGFGFLKGGLDQDIFIHSSHLKQDVVNQDGRLQVIQVHSIEPGAVASGDSSEMAQGNVIFYNPTKGFGFVAVNDGGENAYLAAKIVRASGCGNLAEGQPVKILVGSNNVGRGRVVTRIAPLG
jgi:cold shock CspA family protein